MKRLSLILALLAGSAAADGFAMPDLTGITVDTVAFGPNYIQRAEPGRITIACLDCGADFIAIDVLMGRSTDGTEGRYRSGETTLADMEAICASGDPTCRLEAIEVGDAVGWVSVYEGFPGPGSTAALFLDGDLLTIRSIAPDTALARENADIALRTVAPQIVGAGQ